MATILFLLVILGVVEFLTFLPKHKIWRIVPPVLTAAIWIWDRRTASHDLLCGMVDVFLTAFFLLAFFGFALGVVAGVIYERSSKNHEKDRDM